MKSAPNDHVLGVPALSPMIGIDLPFGHRCGESFRSRRRSLLLKIAGLVMWLGAVVPGVAAAPPEVRQVRVPEEKIAAWFPAGTELKVLPVDRFEMLVARARAEGSHQRPALPPRIVHARHSARWEEGLLRGHSELSIRASNGEGILPLTPWTPAIRGGTQLDRILGLSPNGQFGLRVSPTLSRVSIEWELVARPQSLGRGFTLGLPGDGSSVLTINIPKGWIPSGPESARIGPLAIDGQPDQSRWEFAGSHGLIDLNLQNPDDPDAITPGGRLWVSGLTRIDFRGSGGRGDDSGNWTTDWTVESGRRSPASLVAQLDEGLELISVTGPGVDQFRLEKTTNGTQVVVTFSNGTKSPSKVSFKGHAAVPLEGLWTVPSIRPIDAIWTGGTTSVTLDQSRVVAECRERGGRRLPSIAIENPQVVTLTFESRSPEPVADLVLRKPRVDSSCTVIGQLNLGESAPKLECRLKWSMPRGTPPELGFDLPPTWIADRVQLLGQNDPLVWHTSVHAAGSTGVTVLLPPGIGNRNELTLIIGATSTIPGGRGQIDLPRIRPRASAIVDECWIARIDATLRLEPISAKGIAWIDPFQVSTFDRTAGFPDLTASESKRIALAWRCVEENASARATLKRVDSGAIASIQTDARLSPDGNFMVLDGRIVCRASENLKALPIWLADPRARPTDWEFRLDQQGGSSQNLVPSFIDPSTYDENDFPTDGVAWKLPLPTNAKQDAVIRFHTRLPWAQRGTLPLLFLPKSYFPRALITIEVPRQFQVDLVTEGLRNLNPEAIDFSEGRAASEPRRLRGDRRPDAPVVYALAYSDPVAKLEMKVRRLEAKPVRPLVREALLTTTFDAHGLFLNRLRLQVQSEGRETVEFSMPAMSKLARVEVDGRSVDPFRTEQGLSVSLPASSTTKSLTTVVVDYLVHGKPSSRSTQLRPELPIFQVPCLSFTWEILTPTRWKVVESAPGLHSLPKDRGGRWPFNLPIVGETTWLSPRSNERSVSADYWRWLSDRVQNIPLDNLTLEECLSLWDSGTVPIVIDRVALSASGLGPKSSLTIQQGANAGDRAIARSIRERGITLVSFGEAILVTTEESGTGDPSSGRRQAVLQAIAWDTDVSDRYQSLNRWLGETTPRSAAPDEPASGTRRPPGWTAWTFTSAAWPAAGVFVEMVDIQSQSLAFFWGGILSVVLYLIVEAGLHRKGAIGLTVLLSGSTLLLLLGPGRLQPLFTGALTASLAIAAIQLVWSKRQVLAQPPIGAPPPRSEVRRPVQTAVALILGGLAVSATRGAGAPEADENSSPIIALIPYKGRFDPSRRPDRVILRLRDFERLESRNLPAQAADSISEASIRAVAVGHRVVRINRQEAVVETDFDLAMDERPSSTWDVTVSGTRRISATLDGVETPVLIRPAGQRASIPVAGVGPHRLTIKRSVSLLREAAITRLLLPVDPFPSAQISIDPSRESSKLGTLSSRGFVSLRTDGRTAGLLGPVDQIEITWNDVTPAGTAAKVALDADGLLLWDIEPAGDRIRARFTYHGVPRLSTVRFKIDPSLIARDVECPGFVDIRRERSGQETVWAFHVDPPLTDGSTIGLEFWRPAASAERRIDREPNASGIAPLRRVFPQLDPIAVDRFVGAIGVRRPGKWTGRLAPLPGVEPITDESFVKMWGDLPPEPLTLSGITRFVRPTPLELTTGPAVEKVRVRPSALFQISAGKIDVGYEADFSENLGHLGQAMFRLPPNFHITEVDAPGMTDWSKTSGNQLRLRFDRVGSARRKLKIRGWVSVDEKPLESGPKRLRVITPWIRWLDVDADPGLFAIESASKATIDRADGLKLVSSDESNAGSVTDSRRRLLYRVDDPTQVGEIFWELMPPRLTVSIDSQVTIHGDWAEWIAVLRYDAIGGPLSTILLNIPTAWASSASIQLPGNAAQITKESRESTTYTLNPERPIWGSQRLILRAERPSTPRTPFRFPEIAPLGRGVTDTFLNLVNATGQPYKSFTASGLQAIAESDRFRRGEFTASIPVGEGSTSFHVQKDKWTIELERPQVPSDAPQTPTLSTRTLFAEHSISLSASGEIAGEARYDVALGGSWYLPIHLPRGSEVLLAVVGETSVMPARVDEELWMIPIDRTATRHVQLIWRRLPIPIRETSCLVTTQVEIPRPLVEPASTIVRFNLPDSLAANARLSSNRLEPLAPEGVGLVRARSVARRIVDRLSAFDRGSAPDRKALVSLLTEHELSLRSSTRNASRVSENPDLASRRDRIEQNLASVNSERNTVAVAVKSAGMEDLAREVQNLLGQSDSSTPPSDDVLAMDSSQPARIREIGTPRFYSSFDSGGTASEPVTLGISATLRSKSAKLSELLELCFFCIPMAGSIVVCFPWLLELASTPIRWFGLVLLIGWAAWFGGVVLLGLILAFACGFAPLQALYRSRVQAESEGSALTGVHPPGNPE